MEQPKQYEYSTIELRLYPTKSQEEYLSKAFGCSRFLWNYFLDKNIKQYQEDKTFIFGYDMQLHLTRLKNQEEYKWLKETDFAILQQSILNLEQALLRFIKCKQEKHKGKKIEFPKFKSKSNKQSFTTICGYNKYKGSILPTAYIDFSSYTFKLPKLKTKIKFRHNKPFNGKLLYITIKKSCSGKYFAYLVYRKEKEIIDYEPDLNKSIGLDFGLKTFITTSSGDKINSPEALKKNLKKLKKLNRQHSKKKTNSKNKEKSRVKLAKLHEKIANQRKDFNHKLSRKLVDNYDFIFIEDLNLEAMKNRWGRKVGDLSYYQFTTFINYKAIKAGKFMIKIDRYYPSSKTCSSCGYKKEDLHLNDRSWICPVCNTRHDRDVNAAINILNEGLKNFKDTAGLAGIKACGEQSSI